MMIACDDDNDNSVIGFMFVLVHYCEYHCHYCYSIFQTGCGDKLKLLPISLRIYATVAVCSLLLPLSCVILLLFLQLL